MFFEKITYFALPHDDDIQKYPRFSRKNGDITDHTVYCENAHCLAVSFLVFIKVIIIVTVVINIVIIVVLVTLYALSY